ncbi:MAG: hypothetical protein IJS68_00015 [Clostridia bacterium]|nr:hypothetical protein [Clostridia bacterium]
MMNRLAFAMVALIVLICMAGAMPFVFASKTNLGIGATTVSTENSCNDASVGNNEPGNQNSDVEMNEEQGTNIVATKLNQFVQLLGQFDTYGLFSPFVQDGLFRSDVLGELSEEDCSILLAKTNTAIGAIENYLEANASPIYNELCSNDEAQQSLNALYDEILLICGF